MAYTAGSNGSGGASVTARETAQANVNAGRPQEAAASDRPARVSTSSHSGSGGGDCVEVARNLPGVVLVRDSKDQAGTELEFTGHAWSAFVHAMWSAFVHAIKYGELGL